MLFVVLEFILSLFFTVAQFVVFCAVWTAFIVGVFVVVRMLLSAYLNPFACNLVAFSIASSHLFQLVELCGKRSAARKMILDGGPPVVCMGFSWFTSIVSPHSCTEYYEALQSNIFWQMNVVHVSGTLLNNTVISLASAFGEALGGFVQSFLNKLDWWYRVPAFFISSICLLSAIFAIFGYRFDIFYGLIRIDFKSQEITRSFGKKDSYEHEPLSERKFVECKQEVGPFPVVSELYQKAFCRYSFAESECAAGK